MPVISRQGILKWAACVAAETLPAASPIISNDRMTAFWCSRLARKAASSSPATKLCASRAASSMSRRSAASRAGNSAINGFGLFQDRPAADEIPAGFDRLPLDQIDGTPEKSLQRVFEIGECRKVVARGGLEGDEEVGVAAGGIEPGAARSRAEDLQPRHAKAAAERGQRVALCVNLGQHGALRSFRGECSSTAWGTRASAKRRSSPALFR